jgi:KDO2-lipid IV(A) lauroyltransferase
MPKGPAAIALKTDSPIVPVVLIRREDNSFSLIFEDPIIYSTKGDKDTDIKELMSLYLPSFEKYIRMYPGQWYAFKRIWS